MLLGYKMIVASQWRHPHEWKTNMPSRPSVASRITKVKVLGVSDPQIVHFCNSHFRYQFVGRFENWRFCGRILMRAENVFDCHEMITIFFFWWLHIFHFLKLKCLMPESSKCSRPGTRRKSYGFIFQKVPRATTVSLETVWDNFKKIEKNRFFQFFQANFLSFCMVLSGFWATSEKKVNFFNEKSI